MIKSPGRHEEQESALELLRFLDQLLRAIGRVDLGDSGIAQLTFLELRILVALGEAGESLAIGELADLTSASVGQSGQACQGLRGRGLIERADGGRGPERSVRISSQGRRLLGSLRAHRQAAVESFISRLNPSERLRLDGAAHLLGGGLERLSGSMLPA